MGDDDDPEDLEKKVMIHESRLDAMSNLMERYEEENRKLRTEVETLTNRLAELENLVEPDPGKTEYEQLTKDRKVWRVRVKLAETASGQHGKAKMGYKDVMWLFDGHPSSGHCYDLMERAGEADGYEYGKGPDGERRITVNLEGVNDERLIHAVKEGYEPEAA